MDDLRRALVIEDNPDDVFLIGRTLKKHYGERFEINWANSYKALLQTLEKDLEVVLLDYALPGDLEFPAALNLTRQIRPDLPIVVVSVFLDDDYGKRAFLSGVEGFVSKRNFELLPDEIERAILARRVIMENRAAGRQAAETIKRAKTGPLGE